MKISLLVLSAVFALFIRVFRWLSILQQKEYRLDRVWLFLLSSEGKSELMRVFPKKSDFSWKNCKRPKITLRILGVFLLFLGLTSVLGLLFFGYVIELPIHAALIFLLALVFCVLLLVAAPLLLMLSIVPTAVVAHFVTECLLWLCWKKITHSSPLIIGITGSYGKTSTKQLLAWILSTKYSVYATQRSFNTTFSIARSIVCEYASQEVVILEYGAYKKGEIARIARFVRPAMALITGIARQHLALFGSLQAIVEAKSELVAALPEKSTVFCNTSNPKTSEIVLAGSKKKNLAIQYIDHGTFKSLGFSNIHLDEKLQLCFAYKSHEVRTKLIGKHYMETIALAVAAASNLSVAENQIVSALEKFVPSEMYIQSSIDPKTRLHILNDGRTTNESGFTAMLDIVKEKIGQTKGKHVNALLFGGIVDLGQKSSVIHTKIAVLAKDHFDRVLYSGTEGLEEFQVVFGSACVVVSNAQELHKNITTLSSNDLLVLEGKVPHYAKNLF